MLRVKDAEKSLQYYQDVLGMSRVATLENEEAGFNLYFLGYPGKRAFNPDNLLDIPTREGLLELTWNYGTEKDETFSYHDGNKDPQGFGHICGFPVLLDEKKVSGLKGHELNTVTRHLGRQLGCRLPAFRGLERELEEAPYRWPNEERGLFAGSRWILDRDCPEREVLGQGKLLKRRSCLNHASCSQLDKC